MFKKFLTKGFCSFLIIGLALIMEAMLATATHAQGPTDDFNRPDGPLGPNWTVHDGSFNIVNNAARGGPRARATYNGASSNIVEADVTANGSKVQYTGLLLSYGAGVNNLLIKVQEQNGSGQFTHVGCQIGNGDSSFGRGFFSLNAAFSKAHMKVTRVDNDVIIEFTNIDGGIQPDQLYFCAGAPPPEGNGVGILGYQNRASIDNFEVPVPPPDYYQNS